MIYVLLFLAAALLITAIGIIASWRRTPDVSWLITTNPEETEFMRFRKERGGKIRQTWVELSRISPYLVESVIMAEDRNFLTHHGFYWEEMWNSMLKNIRNGRILRGGSSITQQLAKNVFLFPERSFRRKFRETLISLRLERDIPKARILEIYLNVIEWGEGIYGAEEASRHYFGKPASLLSLSEAIRLAACVPNPRVFSPLDPSDSYLNEREIHILRSLEKHGRISRLKSLQAMRELSNFHETGYEPPRTVPFSGVDARLEKPGFWTSRIKDPDSVVMSPGEIKEFNLRARRIAAGVDIFSLPECLTAREVRDKVIEASGLDIHESTGGGAILISEPPSSPAKYGSDGTPLSSGGYFEIVRNLGTADIAGVVEVRYAIIVRHTEIYCWPSAGRVRNGKHDHDFNRSLLDSLLPGDKAAVVHRSPDGEWLFAMTGFVDGWIRAEDAAFAPKETISEYPGKDFLVVTSPDAATKNGAELRMGTKLRFSSPEDGSYIVKLPSPDAYGNLVFTDDRIRAGFVHEGFLPYTKAGVIEAAFKFLGTAYSWGGGKEGEDCSSYIKAVFGMFGIELPRNSSTQSTVGRMILKNTVIKKSLKARRSLAKKWLPGMTLLRLTDHIMLYLGEYGGRRYAIHSAWEISSGGGLVQIGKVAVTDLDLGRGSEKGSLFERIVEVSAVEPEISGFRGLWHDFVFALDNHPWRHFRF
ncbi:MAG: monofunctional biosynthetic peptidoglycan transglycosylase [Candidatus Dadabacteria bacterium]|nr:monofunctional biosynthetic peptidoglycan transglycosylase [Candidatus Dadabacteria bacterium]